MKESKIEITSRLRREGRWAEASRFMDTVRAEARKAGLKRAEAAEHAWYEVAKAYPPMEQAEPDDDTADDLLDCIVAAAGREVDEWEAAHEVELPDKARDALVGSVVAYAWVRGLTADNPVLALARRRIAGPSAGGDE
jgi:hypothetical protein